MRGGCSRGAGGRAASGGGAGRPSKRYRSTALDTGLPSPRKGDDLLIMLLGEALSRLPREEAELMAETVGEEYGRRLAEQMSTGQRVTREN